ncbi:MAG TPA: DUF1015 family protein [Saprospiraceae bacterium]|nr:DUF1015 family protein [Saprospiraceae bacterium]
MKIHAFRAYCPNVKLITDPDTFFATVKYDFAKYFKEGFFTEIPEDGFYICEIHTASSVHTGFVASVDIEEYLDHHILKHENTLTSTEENLTELLVQRKAMIKPVLLTYKPNDKLNKLIRRARRTEPFFSVYFEREKQEHIYYKISEPDVVRAFEKAWDEHLPKAYIADGHHRCATSASLYQSLKKNRKSAQNYRYLLCAFFPFDQLVIHEFNRVVDLPGEISSTMFLVKLSALCDIKHLNKSTKPRKPHELTLYLNREWYRIRWKKKILKKYAQELVIMDTDILNHEVLADILGIRDVRSDNRLSYVDGISGVQGLTEKAEKSALRIGFCLYPITFKDLVTVADAGKTLPPKSTWFEPRVKNGLISQRI